MRRLATHLGLPLLILGAFELLLTSAVPAPARRAKTARTAATTRHVHPTVKARHAAASRTAAKPVVAPIAVAPAPAAAAAGMRIYRDPETGMIGTPPADEAARLTDPTLEQAGEPTLTLMPDGSLMLELNGTGQEFATITRGADGKPQFRCVQGPRPQVKNVRVASAAQPEER
jgi:hypothetical protein